MLTQRLSLRRVKQLLMMRFGAGEHPGDRARVGASTVREYLGRAPRLLVADNLNSAIHNALFYDSEVNRSYSALATHFGVGILPARPKRPCDNAAVEAGVCVAQSYILGRLRSMAFLLLAECNAAIAVAVERMNSRAMRRLGNEPPPVVRND